MYTFKLSSFIYIVLIIDNFKSKMAGVEGSDVGSTKSTLHATDLPKVQCSEYSEEKQSEKLILNDVVKRLEQFAPLKYAEPWDNVGLLIEPHDTNRPIKKIMLTIDLTDEVLAEAVEEKTDLIISYHPPIFVPIKRINNNKWKERIISTCLAHNIAVYSPHTAWDVIQGGVNDWLTSIFHLKEYYPIQPTTSDEKYTNIIVVGHKADEAQEIEKHLNEISKKALGEDWGKHISINPVANSSTHVLASEIGLSGFLTGLYSSGKRYETVTVAKRPLSPSKSTGTGRYAQLMEPIPLLKAVKKVKSHVSKIVLRIALPPGKNESQIMINTVAVCAGAGGSVLKGTKADLYITGEMSHHDILDATHNGAVVLLLEHSDSERGYLESFQPMLKHRLFNYLDDLDVYISKKDKEPVGYV